MVVVILITSVMGVSLRGGTRCTPGDSTCRAGGGGGGCGRAGRMESVISGGSWGGGGAAIFSQMSFFGK